MPPITPNSKVALTLSAFIVFTGAVITLTWQLSEARNQIMNELSAMRKVQEQNLKEQWTQSDHERFAVKLERSNRSLNLIVPNVNDRS